MFNLLKSNMITNNVNNNGHYYDGNNITDTMSFLGTLSPAASSVDSLDIKLHSPMSTSVSPTHGIFSNTSFMNDPLIGTAIGMPCLTIIEQPIEKFRFRYKSEMAGTHGSLTGNNSDKVRKPTYPAVRLDNFDGRAIIRCSIYQVKSDVPHAHRLVIKAGLGEKDDPHDIEVSPERGYTAVFQGMGIIHTAKKHLITELTNKMLRILREELHRKGIYRNFTHLEEAEITRQAESESKAINLNTVRLKFEAFTEEGKILRSICPPVFSHGINNLKSALTGELKIVRMDHVTASCVGGQEIYILVEKVTKNNIRVRFFECDAEDNEIWSEYGKFSQIDVHHQYAIVFKVPPYKDLNIEKPVQVCMELVRPSDGARSEPRVFKYKPTDKIGKKRVRCSESFSSNELPATINNVSFGSSISVSDSMINKDPDFFKKVENVDSDEFNLFFQSICSDYQKIAQPSAEPLEMDGASKESSLKHENPHITMENINLTQKVASELRLCLLKKPAPERIERLVNILFNDECTADGNNALHASILCEQYQHFQYFLVLLSKMKHFNILDIKNNLGETALHLAVKIKNPTVIELLLPVGANPNIVDQMGNTPLHLAVSNNLNMEKYNKLLFATNVNIENFEGFTPLHLAILNGDLTCVKMLVKANADVNKKYASNGNTALHISIKEKNVEIVKFLLEKTNARIDEENFNKTTPVHLSKLLANESKDSAEIFQMLSTCAKKNGLEFLIIKTEPEDDSSCEEDIENLTIKTEPSSPPPMDIVNNVSDLKGLGFTTNCIDALSKILDNSNYLKKLSRDLEFQPVEESFMKMTTSLLLNYANVTRINVYTVREILNSYGLKIAVEEIDKAYGIQAEH